jgi:hypothetical protein
MSKVTSIESKTLEWADEFPRQQGNKFINQQFIKQQVFAAIFDHNIMQNVE